MDKHEVSSTTETQPSVSREQTRACCYRPNVDIIETTEALILKADLPGSKADGITLDYDKGLLNLHASVGARDRDNAKALLSEYGVGDFHRVFEISEEIDADNIDADYKNGVLTLTLPKAASSKPKKIAVKEQVN